MAGWPGALWTSRRRRSAAGERGVAARGTSSTQRNGSGGPRKRALRTAAETLRGVHSQIDGPSRGDPENGGSTQEASLSARTTGPCRSARSSRLRPDRPPYAADRSGSPREELSTVRSEGVPKGRGAARIVRPLAGLPDRRSRSGEECPRVQPSEKHGAGPARSPAGLEIGQLRPAHTGYGFGGDFYDLFALGSGRTRSNGESPGRASTRRSPQR